jgi:hypothetical protein
VSQGHEEKARLFERMLRHVVIRDDDVERLEAKFLDELKSVMLDYCTDIKIEDFEVVEELEDGFIGEVLFRCDYDWFVATVTITAETIYSLRLGGVDVYR